MSRKYLTSIDLSKNELQNAVMQNLASAPSTPLPGQMYFNTTSFKFEYNNGSIWIDPTARVNHTGTQLASTISNFDSQVQNNRLDQLTTPTSTIDMGGQLVTNVATPASSNDATNKAYVDALVNGADWKQSVRVATTSNIVLSGLSTIDSIGLVAGDRVLVKEQTTGSDNGLYSAAVGAWVRTEDANVNAEVTASLAVMVEEGTLLGNSQWVLAAINDIDLGVTDLTFVQIGAAAVLTAGTGITLVGNTINVADSLLDRKYSALVTAGLSITMTHNLNTLDVSVQLYEVLTGATVECDVVRSSVNQVELGFATAVANGQYRVVIHG